MVESTSTDYIDHLLSLVDWRRRTGDLYRLRAENQIEAFRAARDELFKTHPQTPIEPAELPYFNGIEYFEPNPDYRVKAIFEPGDGSELVIETGGEDGAITYRKAGTLHFDLLGEPQTLTVLGLIQYGGGLFVPFKDATSGHETYGGGRYLFDTAKNTDGLVFEFELGQREVWLDFNYAYHPSCTFSARWACPLAPPENRLTIPVRAGEKLYRHPEL